MTSHQTRKPHPNILKVIMVDTEGVPIHRSGEEQTPDSFDTPLYYAVTTSGTVAAGAKAVSFLCRDGTVTVTEAFGQLPIGRPISMAPAEGRRFGAIPYTITGTGELEILEVR